jgi:hypothetical protein
MLIHYALTGILETLGYVRDFIASMSTEDAEKTLKELGTIGAACDRVMSEVMTLRPLPGTDATTKPAEKSKIFPRLHGA